jgi:serine/threonine protein kinase
VDGQQVALKALHADVMPAVDMDAIRHSIEAIAAVDHVALAGDVALFSWRGDQILSRQYIRGEDLGTAGAGSSVPTRAALEIAHEVAGALSAVASQAGLFHGDIKPSNLFIDVQGQVELVDFSLAHTQSDALDRTLTMFFGSVGFMAPERADRSPHERSDVYSIGLLLTWMLTGTMPQRTSINPRRHEARRDAQKVALIDKGQSEALVGLIHNCTAYKPDERPDIHPLHCAIGALIHAAPGADLEAWARP